MRLQKGFCRPASALSSTRRLVNSHLIMLRVRSFSTLLRRGRASTLLPKPQPQRWPSSTTPFSTQIAPHPTSTVTVRTANPAVDTAYLLDNERQVEVEWRNGHQSFYDWTWLRVNCPSFLHESGQRTVFPGDVDPEVKPLQVRTRAHDNRMFARSYESVRQKGFGFREPTPHNSRMFVVEARLPCRARYRASPDGGGYYCHVLR